MATKVYTHYTITQEAKTEIGELLNDLKTKIKKITQALKRDSHQWILPSHNLHNKPWILVIGPSKSGKSSLVQQTQIKFKEIFKQNCDDFASWLSNEAVFIEVPGKCITDKELVDSWQGIFQCLKSQRRNQPIDGIILTLNLQLLAEQTKLQRNAQIADIYKILEQFTAQSPNPIPVYLVFTHADMIHGFSEYFDDLNQQERHQACGFLFPKNIEKIKLLNYFQQELNKLLGHLNDQLITRLHQARNFRKRILIKDFPLQLESLSNIFLEVLKQLYGHELNKNSKFYYGGFFLTSSQQSGSTQDTLSKQISESLSLSLPTTHPQLKQQKNFFSKQLLQKIIPQQSALTNNLGNSNQYRLFYKALHLSIFGLAFLGLLLLANNFHSRVEAFSNAEDYIQNYQLLTEYYKNKNYAQKRLSQTLSEIDALVKVNKSLDKINFSWINKFPLEKLSKTKKLTQKAYQQAIHNDLLPHILMHIEADLSETKNPSKIYSALKAYLMLAKPQHKEPKYLTKWLVKHLRNDAQVNAKNIPQLAQHLEMALQEKLPPVMINYNLVKQARDYINVLPESYVAYLLLKHTANYYLTKNKDNDTPPLYTIQGFEQIYAKNIDSICQQIIRGNYVLGPKETMANANLEKLKQEINTLYFSDYRNWWELYLYSQQNISFTNLQQAETALAALTKNTNSLKNVLETIRKNTLPPKKNTSLTSAFDDNLSRHFHVLNQMSPEKFEKLQYHLKKIHDYLRTISQANNPEEAAFIAAKKRFSQTNYSSDIIGQSIQYSERLPQPLNRWLHSLCVNTWYLILNKAHAYLNDQWQQTVMKDYYKFIANRYPIAKQSNREINLKRFIQFFAYRGTLDNYFNEYLQAFLDTEKANWQIKKIDGLGLSLPVESLQELTRAQLIRSMFFTNATQQLNVGFSLQALEFEPIVKNIILDVAGQKVFDYQGSSKVSYLQWPGPIIGADVVLKIDNISGEKMEVSEHGPWAWFKLLDKVNIKNIDDTRHFYLTFILNGSAAKYKLTSNKLINPFIPGVIEHFKLPDKLV